MHITTCLQCSTQWHGSSGDSNLSKVSHTGFEPCQSHVTTASSINNKFFLSLDLFLIEMDSFQHTPWSIITSLTYQLALNSVSRAPVIHTWKLEVPRKSKTATATSLIPDTTMMSWWHPLTHRCIGNGHPRYVLDNTGVWEALFVVSFGWRPLHLSLPHEGCNQFWGHSRKDIAVQKIYVCNNNKKNKNHTMMTETNGQPFPVPFTSSTTSSRSKQSFCSFWVSWTCLTRSILCTSTEYSTVKLLLFSQASVQ